MTKKNEIVAFEKTEVIGADQLFSPATPYLFNVDRIEKPNCKLCTSELRDKAEALYDAQNKRKNYAEIRRKLEEEQEDFNISEHAIKNHLIYHYKTVLNNATLQEYADDVQQWVGLQTNKVASLKARIAVLEREMFTIGKDSEDLDIIERRKSAETMKKLAETILTYENKLSEFEEAVKPVTLIFNQLKIIVDEEMQHIESIKTKKVLSTVLSRLKESVGRMMIE
jgi:hypothetical protein